MSSNLKKRRERRGRDGEDVGEIDPEVENPIEKIGVLAGFNEKIRKSGMERISL